MEAEMETETETEVEVAVMMRMMEMVKKQQKWCTLGGRADKGNRW
jgi:hypothetical protein